MDISVKKLMARGKSLTILLTSLVLLSGCNATTSQYYNSSESTTASVHTRYVPNEGLAGIAYNVVYWNAGRLPKQDQEQQEQAVMFALDNLYPGEITRWYNGNTGTRGAVKVSMSYPQGSGYCRVIMSQIVYKKQAKDFKETACKNSIHNSWRFIR